MRLRLPLKTFWMLAVVPMWLASLASDPAWAQPDCARCVMPLSRTIPVSRQLRNDPYAAWNGTTTRFRPERPMVEDTPPVPSPYYSVEQDTPVSGKGRTTKPVGRSNSILVPTNAVTPAESAPADRSTPRTNTPQNNFADKIAQRYSDPRVVRMLNQMTASTTESLYAEVSDLIDDRHIKPAGYARRVDNGIEHLIKALDVPSFVQAAGVSGSSADIAEFKQELEELRTTLRVRNNSDALSALRNVQLRAAQSMEINPAAVGLEFLYGATDSLDQFSMLLPPEKLGGPSVGLRDNVVGIGVEVEPHQSGLKILKLLPGGPAAQADLRRGDIITHVDGTDLGQMELNRAVDFIVGAAGTPVQIQATRAGRSGKVTLVRQRVAVSSVVDVRMEDASQGIGYLKLEQFAESTMNDIDAALARLHQQGMKSLIMDLRGNPGGLLTTAIALSDKFLPAGTIVSTKGRTPDDNSKEVARFERTWSVPLVVLIDHNSASASEIFAAAIQENGRGLIVGEKSYGKGTVQTLFPLQSVPGALRLTTAKFYSPQGREMAGAGVTPDIRVAGESTDAKEDDAVLGEAIKRIVDPKVKQMANQYRRTGDVSDDSHLAA